MRKLIAQAMVLAMVAGFMLLAAGCTGEQLAPGGKGVVRVAVDPNGRVVNLYIETTRDTSIQSVSYSRPDGSEFKLDGYNGNGSTLGGIQGKASADQLYYWNLGFSQAMQAMVAMMGKGGTVTIPTTQPAK
jgi:hypothetical protein